MVLFPPETRYVTIRREEITDKYVLDYDHKDFSTREKISTNNISKHHIVVASYGIFCCSRAPYFMVGPLNVTVVEFVLVVP